MFGKQYFTHDTAFAPAEEMINITIHSSKKK